MARPMPRVPPVTSARFPAKKLSIPNYKPGTEYSFPDFFHGLKAVPLKAVPLKAVPLKAVPLKAVPLKAVPPVKWGMSTPSPNICWP